MRIHEFLSFFLQHSKRRHLLLILFGLLSGLSSIGLLALINYILQKPAYSSFTLGLVFITLLVGKIVMTSLSQFAMVRFTQDTIFDLCMTLCRKLTQAPFRFLEDKGTGPTLSIFTDDVMALAWAFQNVPQLVINVAVLTGGAAYLAWLSPKAFVAVAAMMLVGAVIYKLLHDRAFVAIYAARDCRSTLLSHLRTLVDGLKELLMHRGRRDAFLSDRIGATIDELRRQNVAATRQYALAEAWTQSIFYGVIGIVLIVLPMRLTAPREVTTGYVLGLLYLMNPFWGIVSTLPTFAGGQVALDKIQKFGVSLDSAIVTTDRRLDPTEDDLSLLEMKGAQFSYRERQNGEAAFVLGPVDFTWKRGQLVFLVGGNGSGKSTLAKLICGLYLPGAGEIRLQGHALTPLNQDWFRQHFSVVFSDYHLFNELLGIQRRDLDKDATEALNLFQLQRKVAVKDGKFSTIDLSQGQRRRLALVTALMEDRPFYIFDEWAADQDPQYKEIFYKSLLPGLRNLGKGVLVITHDDRYFDIGDRVIQLDDGKVHDSWASSVVAKGASELRR
jgi:putative ATP-binding cassette transporter